MMLGRVRASMPAPWFSRVYSPCSYTDAAGLKVCVESEAIISESQNDLVTVNHLECDRHSPLLSEYIFRDSILAVSFQSSYGYLYSVKNDQSGSRPNSSCPTDS
jgi:hypothetical protein